MARRPFVAPTFDRSRLMMAAGAAFMLVALSTAPAAAGQDSLSAARELYAGAAYDEALSLLERLRFTSPPPADAIAIEKYRAFCLLALNRGADAERAIAGIVQAHPLYLPPGDDMSPRLQSVFTAVRRRLLPSIVRDRYAAAKSAYDRKSWAEAEAGFRQVLDVLRDPELRDAAGQVPLADIKMVAAEFYDLSRAAGQSKVEP